MSNTIFDDIIEDFLKKEKSLYNRTDRAPWAKRKDFEILRSTLDPFISRDISVLKVCSKNSIYEHREVLVKYLNEVHSLSYEISETWVIAFSTGNTDVLTNLEWQVDGLKYFDDELKTATHGVTPESSYKAMRMNIDRGRQYVNLHIGSSATKADLMWFIKNTWKDEVEPKLKTRAFTGRITPAESLRRFITARLKKLGVEQKDIRKYWETAFGYELADSTYRQPFHEPAYEADLFFEARAQLGKDLGKKIQPGDRTYELIIDKSNHNHFKLQ